MKKGLLRERLESERGDLNKPMAEHFSSMKLAICPTTRKPDCFAYWLRASFSGSVALPLSRQTFGLLLQRTKT